MEKIEYLDPAKVQADPADNIRHALLETSVESMMSSIVERGGVMEPVEAAKLEKAAGGFTHRLTAGYIRHAAVTRLNKEQKAGLKLPVIVRQPADEKDRLARQLSENVERANLSPMDIGHAASRMLAAGFTMAEVGMVFKRPGGRKGTTLQPASPSYIRMHVGFLELPKAIQAKIHDGRLGVSAAQKLLMVTPDQREAVLAAAEEARLKDVEREEKAAEKDAKVAETAEAKEAKLAALTAEVDAATTAKANAIAALEAARKSKLTVGQSEAEFGKSMDEWNEAQRKLHAERLGASKVAIREAEKAIGKATKDTDKASRALKAITEPAPRQTAGPKDVEAATKATGAAKVPRKSGGARTQVALTAQDARAAAADLAKSKSPMVSTIGGIFVKLLAGDVTTKEAEKALLTLVDGVITKGATKKR